MDGQEKNGSELPSQKELSPSTDSSIMSSPPPSVDQRRKQKKRCAPASSTPAESKFEDVKNDSGSAKIARAAMGEMEPSDSLFEQQTPLSDISRGTDISGEVNAPSPTSTPSPQAEDTQIMPDPETSVEELSSHMRQLEETKFLLSEELQATLAELEECQNLNETFKEKIRLIEDDNNTILRVLRDVSGKINQQQERNEPQEYELVDDAKERERKLIQLLQKGQTERILLLKKQEELLSEIAEVKKNLDYVEGKRSACERLIQTHEMTIEVLTSDNAFFETKVAEQAANVCQLQSRLRDEMLKNTVAFPSTTTTDLNEAQRQLDLAEEVNALRVREQMALERANSNWEMVKCLEAKLEAVQARYKESIEKRGEDAMQHEMAKAEWRSLQRDLLVAVKVADEMKQETHIALEKAEERMLELEQINFELMSKAGTVTDEDGKPPSTKEIDSEVPVIKKLPPYKFFSPTTQNVNVRSLIENIENQKSNKTEEDLAPEESSLERDVVPLGDHQQIARNKKAPINPPFTSICDEVDPFHKLMAGQRGSLRNALLKWCQLKTANFKHVEITNFSSSWTDGLALCALLSTYLPDMVRYDELSPHDKLKNFEIAFTAAESVGIPTSLNVNDMLREERPDWATMLEYIKKIYITFECE